MVDVANELDELGLVEYASNVDAATRELTSQIEDLGLDLAPGLEADQIGEDAGMVGDEEDDESLNEQVRARIRDMTQQLGDPGAWTREQKLEFLQHGAFGGPTQQRATMPSTPAMQAA